jgi:hypothetical protein
VWNSPSPRQNTLARRSSARSRRRSPKCPTSPDGHTFYLAFRVLTPVVILVLVSAAFYSVNLNWLVSDIWLVSVYYFGVRVVFNGVTERCLLPN